MQLYSLADRFPQTSSPEYTAALEYLQSQQKMTRSFGHSTGLAVTHNLGSLAEGVYPDTPAEVSRSWLDDGCSVR